MVRFPWHLLIWGLLFLTVVFVGAAIVLKLEGPVQEETRDDLPLNLSAAFENSKLSGDCYVAPKWTYGSAVYFCVVTLTTIGYGDFAPATSAGRLFVVVYGTVGLLVTFYYVSVLTEWLMGEATILAALKRKKRALEQGKSERFDPKRGRNLAARLRRSWNKNVGSFISALGFWALCLLGGLIFAFTEDWSYGEAFYFSFVSATTIGFGDLTVTSPTGKVVVCFFAIFGLCFYSYVVSSVARNFAQRINKKLIKENLIEISDEVVSTRVVIKSMTRFTDAELAKVAKALAKLHSS